MTGHGAVGSLRWPVYPGVPDGLVDGPEELRRKVRELATLLPDWIAAVWQDGRLVAGRA